MREQPARILLVEDGSDDAHDAIRASSRILSQRGFAVTEASGVVEALEQARRQSFDAVLTDIRMHENGGPVFLRTFRQLQPGTPMIVINSDGFADAATEAMEAGAFTYITRPFAVEDVRHAIDRALRRTPSAGTPPPAGLVGHSRAMAGVEWTVAQAAMDSTPVLIQGEQGTGKALVARSIHLHSDRASGPFVKIRCADLPDDVLERLLFGCTDAMALVSAPGSLATASGGTLVLDEVDSLGLALQDRLLGLLGDAGPSPHAGDGSRTADVRIVSTSRVDVVSLVHQDRFRMDLYRRLAGVKITLPPLRDRMEDLPLLAEHFLQELGAITNKTVDGVSPEAMVRLLQHDWPGNVGELREAIERAFIVTETSTIQPEDLPATMRTRGGSPWKPASQELALRPDRP
jgi:DNA-binding NtrC family response regulator